MILSLFSGAAALAIATPLAAIPADDAASAPPAGSFHDDTPANIVVTAPFTRDADTALSGVTVLSGADLVREIRPTIGETLARTPGVSATSFGPNASRPVLRGFQGDRVRVLTDGIGSFDVSNTSVDHAVVINPLTADRIEVLRGPSALLYGSSAIGGVVNVIDSRIPRRVPDEPIHIDALASYGSAANERSGSGAIEAPLLGKIVFHLDGSYTKTGNLDTGGYLLSPSLRTQAAASTDPDIRDLADLKGTLPNSAAKTWEVAGGAAIVTDTGNLGFSVSHYDNFYGVPVRFSLDPDVEAEQVRLKMKQTREDLRAEVDTGGDVLEKIRFRAGHADYQHAEIEESGEVGTRFFNDSYEARLELVQKQHGAWRGAVGGQMLIRNFNVVGDEAFLPKNETQQYGLFTLQEFDLGPLKAEAGGRYERSTLTADADAVLGNPSLRRSYDAFSGSLGASMAVADGIRLGLNASHTERAPSAEELFANGPHAGTQSFEIGNPDFKTERSWGLEATARAKFDRFTLDASVYHSWFDNYIYETQTGEVRDDLPVFQYSQAKARYYGFEVQGTATLAKFGDYDLLTDASADYVHAQIVGSGPAPRIPPLRLLGGVELKSPRTSGRVEVEWSDKQDRTQPFETDTDSFTLVNASMTVQPFATNRTTLVLSANNIFDVVARRHASFLKDYAPLAGRDLRATMRFTF
ncbi:MAG TPA: TonB-dependent receptor [Sphingomonas sp.]|jgi:iron complex outermembrane receptor protein|uniref:TonB-dependent receptor n=1 Tax=Sphingomonas sp. TaxID=28214 RepID=UPI002ED9D6AB